MSQPEPRTQPAGPDRDSAEMAHLLVLGSAIGIPVVFAIALALVVAAGARGMGALFIAAWAGLIGGTFIGSSIMLASAWALGSAPRPAQEDSSPREAGTRS